MVVSAPLPGSLRTRVCEPVVYEFPEAADALVPVLVVPELSLSCTYSHTSAGKGSLVCISTDHMGNRTTMSTLKAMMQARVLAMAREEGYHRWTAEQTAH